MSKVVVIGNSFTTRLAVIRALANMECEITAVCIGFYPELRRGDTPPMPADAYSRYVSRCLFFERREGRDGLVRLLLNECADPQEQVLLIPTSDFSVVTIDTNQHLLEEKFIFPHIRHEEGAIERWMNKELQKTQARKAGLTAPDSIVLKATNHVYQIPSDIHFPCFTKPLASIGGGKHCQRRCNTLQELQEVVNIAERLGITELLVEDYINIEIEYAVLGWSDGKDVIIPAVISFLEGSKAHNGIALLGRVMPVTGFEPLLAQFKQLIQSIGYVGVFDIDFFKSNGVFYFAEINFRIGGSCHAVTAAGVNLPAMMVNRMLNLSSADDIKPINSTYTYVNERMCFDDWYQGYISSRTYHRLIKSAVISFVSDSEDPVPAEIFEKEHRKNTLSFKRLAKRVFRSFNNVFI